MDLPYPKPVRDHSEPDGLVLMQAPNGQWWFLGRGPATLLYAGSPEDIERRLRFGFESAPHVTRRTFREIADAHAAAAALSTPILDVIQDPSPNTVPEPRSRWF